jgi:uncharacterized protein YbcV (DUF1398 family)
MDKHVEDAITECTRGSDEERLTFPQVVAKLMAAGVERYRADLLRGERVYFLPSGESVVQQARAARTTPAATFSASGVADAVRAIQRQEIGYNDFCRRIMEAGCVDYLVSLPGRRAIYFGRTGDCHVESWPAPN